ncbi:hypothetical protein PT974_12533 [Cladobotryum mycophilum]|uniref:Uncharacterized protein n=1 Tax=Cladobotryum mycophilum TaxID=491253 RepID=A0ABR0S968_9HYPO
MSERLRVWVDRKAHTVEGHTAQAILTFNGRVIWGPQGCHENTSQLAEALAAADPRFQLIVMPKPHSVEGHTYYISVSANGRVYLDKLSTHDNMVSLSQAISDVLIAEDSVICTTSVDKHHEMILLSIKAGKDVYAEWPIASNKAQIDTLLLSGRIKEILDSGHIGKLLSTQLNMYGTIIDRDVILIGLKYFTEQRMGGNP